MSLRLRPVLLLVVVFAALAAGSAAGGINRIENGSFDEDPDPAEWEMVGDTPLAPNAADATSCAPDSGSMAIVHADAVSVGDVWANYCIDAVSTSGSPSFGASLIFAALPDRFGYAQLFVTYFDQAGCTGGSQGSATAVPATVDQTNTSTWVRVHGTGFANALIHSAQLTVLLHKSSGSPGLQVRVDEVYYVETGNAVFFDDFENDSSCRWSAATP